MYRESSELLGHGLTYGQFPVGFDQQNGDFSIDFRIHETDNVTPVTRGQTETTIAELADVNISNTSLLNMNNIVEFTIVGWSSLWSVRRASVLTTKPVCLS